MNFWNTLDRPFFVLAPMADVTDAAFRRLFAKYSKGDALMHGAHGQGRLDVMYTEFVSADGLFRGGFEVEQVPKLYRNLKTRDICGKNGADEEVISRYGDRGKAVFDQISRVDDAKRHSLVFRGSVLAPALEKDLWYTDAERPIVAQFFSRDTDLMKRAAELAVERGFDGIDINMGCPDKNVCKQGAGSAMIKDPEHAQRVIRATMDGAGGLPVSIKTRIGYNKNELETWLPAILETKPSVVILHARTKKQMSKVPADWSQITRAVEIRDRLAPEVLIVGNGDVDSMEDARARAEETGCDGVMIGRGAFGAPWFFREGYEPTLEERLSIAVEHARLYEELYKGEKPFHIMRKHFKAYAHGFDGAKELRVRLMETESADEVGRAINDFLKKTRNNV